MRQEQNPEAPNEKQESSKTPGASLSLSPYVSIFHNGFQVLLRFPAAQREERRGKREIFECICRPVTEGPGVPDGSGRRGNTCDRKRWGMSEKEDGGGGASNVGPGGTLRIFGRLRFRGFLFLLYFPFICDWVVLGPREVEIDIGPPGFWRYFSEHVTDAISIAEGRGFVGGSVVPRFGVEVFLKKKEKEKMTKQNVVVAEAAGLNMAITVAMAESSLLPPPGPTKQAGGYIAISRRKLLKKLETGGGAARINAWVESMRASSPTHIKSVPSLQASTDQSSWILHHPSALSMFEQIMNASQGKQIVMFLDYDGTLSPIVEDPDRAFMSEAMRKAVRDVARYFPTAIVSGRCRDKVYSFVQLAELYYAGSHGMDIKGPAKGPKYKKAKKSVLFQPASEFLPMIDEVYKALVEKTKSIPGAKVENNKFCVSVHFRCVDEKRWSGLAEQVRSVLKEYPKLRLSQGRKVLEIRPTIKWDKGKALEFLLESLGFANCNDVLPVYIGDDRTDEDAFKVLRQRGQGFGILVSKNPKDTNASYSLQEPAEVMDFLHRLVEWKRLSLRGRSRV
ncbi:hypothetical protein H6P81_011510 [Aristolochia fimbriata]|uniref:Trehalose 6-phosphate phosphatase n=1 Tax=Aristolochia fimbriata TaxID=158543 RepID=A0AAV7ERQ2_ARIFI|nr:hypothetical protein H6P81_011510 [Aristolochia fimbriata]